MEKTSDDILDGIPLGCWNIQFIALMGLVFISGPVQYYNSVFTNKFINYTCSSNGSELYGLDACTSNSSQVCSSYEFDQKEERTTFTREFNLVCENMWVSDLFQLILTIGCIVGTVCTGIGDRYGRRAVIRVSSIIHVISILVIGLAPNPFIILLGRFVIGFSYPLLNSTAYTLLTETLPPNKRSLVCFLVSSTFYISVMVIGVIAYFIIEWRMLFLVLSIIPLCLPFIAFYLDESPRWLYQQSRIKEARSILEKAARLNGGTLNTKFGQNNHPNSPTEIENKVSSNNDAAAKDSPNIDTSQYSYTKSENHDKSKSMIHITKMFINNFFGTWAMLKISVVMPVIWFLMATAYFGVPLTGHNLTDNLYLYMIVVGAAELPVSLIGPVLVSKLRNINTGTGLFALLGLSMLGIMIFRDSKLWWIKWVLIGLSMNCIGLLNCLCSLMTCELFPTTLRTTAFAFCKICYYLGFFTASYIESVSQFTFWWLYYAVCCISCAIGSILVRYLPETHGSTLCNTIEDVVDRENTLNETSNLIKPEE